VIAMGEIYFTLAGSARRMPPLSGKYPSSDCVFYKWRGLECRTERIDISTASAEDLELIFDAPRARLIEIKAEGYPGNPNIYLSLAPIAIHLPYLEILHRLLPVPCGEVGKRLSSSELQQLKNRIPDEIYAEMLGAKLRET
jgi:hypothetical protein